MFLINDIYSENCILLNSFSRRFIDIEAWPLLTFFLCLYNQLISIHSILLHITEYRCLKNEIHQIDRNSFFYQGSLLQTLTIHRTAGEGRVLSFFPLYHFHPLTNIHTFICNFAFKMSITYF